MALHRFGDLPSNFSAPASRQQQTGVRSSKRLMASSPWSPAAGAAPTPPAEEATAATAAAAATSAAGSAATSEHLPVKVPRNPISFAPSWFSFALSFFSSDLRAELPTDACRRVEWLLPRLSRCSNSSRRRRPSLSCRGTMTRNCDPLPCLASLFLQCMLCVCVIADRNAASLKFTSFYVHTSRISME